MHKGFKISRKDNTLTITVDLTGDYGDSQSGKTRIVARTEGIVNIDTEKTLGMTLLVWRKKDAPAVKTPDKLPDPDNEPSEDRMDRLEQMLTTLAERLNDTPKKRTRT
jgi:hypothetical protein